MNQIEFFFEEVQLISFNQNTLKKNINYLINNELKEAGEISIIFCSDQYLLEINKQYLKHDYYTDIITFDYVEKNVISGDLFISTDRIKDNAMKYETKVIKELYRVVFHGVLHLVGYKDKNEDEQQLMTEKENFYLSKIDFKNLQI